MTPAMAMLREGIERGVGTIQEAARQTNVTSSLLSKILSGERSVAPDLKPKLSKMHILAGLAMALEATGYRRLFGYIQGDRHPQSMIRRVEKEDAEADAALQPIGWRIIDKDGPEDLTADDKFALLAAAKEITDRVKAEINLLIEWEDRYQLGLLEYLTGEKKNRPKSGNVKS